MKEELNIEANSKPLLIKRFISDGFDIVSLFIVFMLLVYILMNSSLGNTYKEHLNKSDEIKEKMIVSYSEELNAEYQNELFIINLHGFILNCFAGLIAETILFLIIPLLNKDRATIGKQLTGIILFNESRQTKASRIEILGRFIFIFLIESFALYFWTGIYTFLLVPILRFIVMMFNKKNKTLCDYITSTMLIEKISYSSF